MVKRWNYVDRQYEGQGFEVCEAGQWVLADDYDALAARLAEAEALLREANAELRWWIDEHVCCDGHQGRLLNRIDAFLTPVNLEPAPDGSRVLCVADQPPGVACPECGSVDPVDKDGHSAGCSRQAEQ